MINDSFFSLIKDGADFFLSWKKEKPIRIISHYDADGISSAAILSLLLERLNRKYVLTIINQLTRPKLEELKNEPYDYFIFSDLGSSLIRDVGNAFKKPKQVIILDHHQTEDDVQFENIMHINPLLCNASEDEISGSGVSFFFAREIDSYMNRFAYLALVGMLGDLQNSSIGSLNSFIVDAAKESGKVTVKKGLKLFGAQTKPLHKLLERSTNPYIPKVTGSESGAIQFLLELGINPKNERGWRRLVDLSQEELQKLVAGIVVKRSSEENPEDIIGDIFILEDAPAGSPFRDLREFATLLNACGKMNKGSIGVCACLGYERYKKEALSILESYRRELVSALKWVENNFELEKVSGSFILDGGDHIPSNLIGVTVSIISKSILKDSFVLGLANTDDGMIKVSIRGPENRKINLRDLLFRAVNLVGGGEVGGHENAAGAFINVEQKERFIEIMNELLRKIAMEERI
ncbi:hypothetical protein DRJ16_05575 [Candidatus Woesearchaeota archaeon]|nr:MAG: hypothetical protein DRJ16_05575 [Candidatus Woesearchaeota archaeon]